MYLKAPQATFKKKMYISSTPNQLHGILGSNFNFDQKDKLMK